MSSALTDLGRDHDRLLHHLQQMTEVIARQDASLVSLQAEYDTALAERDTLRTEHDAAQAEVEKLQLLGNRPPRAIRLAFCWAHTIRTQSKSRGWGRAGA